MIYEENNSLAIFYYLTKFNCLIVLSLFLEILDFMYIATICFPGRGVMNFEISLIFLIKLFFCITKKSRQKFKYLENEKSFHGETKQFFWRVRVQL